MIVLFADQNAFQLALTSAAIPAVVSGARARGVIDDGRVFIEFDARLPKDAKSALASLGAKSIARQAAPELHPLLCWHQLLPMRVDREPPTPTDGVVILFEVSAAERLVELCGEMLRLGADRLATAALAADDTHQPTRFLLRAVDPPYYTLLRTEAVGGDAQRPIAYVQQRPRVWVERGFTHPLIHVIEPPAGRMLLLRAPGDWRLVGEPVFRDVYADIEVRLPAEATPWRPAQLDARLQVTLRLTRGGDDAPATLWVMHDGAEQQVERLVEHADSALVDRLAFAVGTRGRRRVVVLRARPSQHPPPVLVVRGTAMRSYLKLPNLFVPCGFRVEPPLRRDVIARTLSSDAERITWLVPREDGEAAFVPESLPDIAFRPLSDWVDYVIDQEQVVLDEWVQSTRFDFAPFVSHQQVERAPTTAAPAEVANPNDPPATDGRVAQDSPSPEAAPQPADIVPESPPPRSRKRRELVTRLQAIEQQYLELDAPLDDKRRAAMWRDMARLNTMLEVARDATICWSNLLWEHPSAADNISSAWLASERRAASTETISRRQLEQMNSGHVAPEDAVHLAATLVEAAHNEAAHNEAAHNEAAHNEAADGWGDRVHLAAAVLQRHEAMLPVRVVWLAWQAVTILSGGDVLTLARTRDRLLERLHQGGLELDIDMPSFLRTNLSQGDRGRSVRGEFVHLRRMVHRWIESGAATAASMSAINTTPTRHYADLMLAYGLAVLGESAACQQLVAQVEREFHAMKTPRFDQVHRWLVAAFDERIRSVLAGVATTTPFSQQLLATLDGMSRETRYKIDRLRLHSFILEPHQRIDPYRRWDGRYDDLVRRQLADLYEPCDREQLQQQLNPLLQQAVEAKSPGANESWVLATALELAPRLGEKYTREILPQAMSLLDRLADLDQRARILEKGMLAAAHFDLPEVGRELSARIVQTFRAHQEDASDNTVRSLLGPALRGLRKLGLRDELNGIMNHIARMLRSASPAGGAPSGRLAEDDLPTQDRRLARLSMLLHLAASWLYFGQHTSARQALDEVRDALFQTGWEKARAARLARAYIEALAEAPIEESLVRIRDFLQRAPAPIDTYTTSSHYARLQLDVIDAVVRTLAGDSAAIDPAIRRWLDEDELLVRRRIHRDTRAALAAAGMT
ncbi:MAG: hypothetical protein RIC55_21610 [Pirellulaceae bacterium]